MHCCSLCSCPTATSPSPSTLGRTLISVRWVTRRVASCSDSCSLLFVLDLSDWVECVVFRSTASIDHNRRRLVHPNETGLVRQCTINAVHELTTILQRCHSSRPLPSLRLMLPFRCRSLTRSSASISYSTSTMGFSFPCSVRVFIKYVPAGF